MINKYKTYVEVKRAKEDCYKALYEIQELLRRSEQRHGGFTHD